jgi:ketosteroid isomerase-like protein
MSRENIEVARRIYQAFNRRDDALLGQLIAPDAELHTPAWGPFKRSFKGWEAMKEQWDDLFAAIADFRSEPEAMVDAGDYVVATIHNTGRGVSSGAAVEMHVPVVLEIREDKLVRLEVFETRAEALEAVGLRE